MEYFRVLFDNLELIEHQFFSGIRDSRKRFQDNAPVHKSILVTDYLTMMTANRDEAVRKVIDTLTQEDFNGALQKLLERYNKCIAAGGDYFEGDLSFMCVLSIKVPIRKKTGKLFNDPRPWKKTVYDLFLLVQCSATYYRVQLVLEIYKGRRSICLTRDMNTLPVCLS